MGAARKPLPAAGRLRAARCAISSRAACLRHCPHASGRLDGGARALLAVVRALRISRQHRRRADRRGDGHAIVPRPRSHRLSRRDCRCIERWRRGQRDRRHDDHDDVDRGVAPARGIRGLRRRPARHRRLCRAGRRAAAAILADRARKHRPGVAIDWPRVVNCRIHSRCRGCRQYRDQCERSRKCRRAPLHRRSPVGGDRRFLRRRRPDFRVVPGRSRVRFSCCAS